jgi:hypothetical protein
VDAYCFLQIISVCLLDILWVCTGAQAVVGDFTLELRTVSG